MKHCISKEYGHITSVKAMKQVVISIWNEFEDHRWDHLVESMPYRIQAVIRAKGGSLHFSVILDRIASILHPHKISIPQTLRWWSNSRNWSGGGLVDDDQFLGVSRTFDRRLYKSQSKARA
jgi:hypothetical protein